VSAFVYFVVAGPILWLACREAAASRDTPLAVSPPPFRFPSFRRSPSELLLMTLLDRAVDDETGAALLTGGGGMARLARSVGWLRADGESVAPAGGWWEAEIGVGAVVLGILALAGHDPATLAIVALLAVGAALLMGGSLLTASLFGAFR